MPFFNTIRNKKIILFGASARGKRVLNNLIELGFNPKNIQFCDNDQKKWNKNISGVKVISLKELQKLSKSIPIIISSSVHYEINQQLTKLGFKKIYYLHSLLFKEQIYEKYDKKFVNIVKSLNEKCLLDNEEKFSIYSSVKNICHLSGDIAEVGVYKGGSAKIICEVKGKKRLHLFDTFEGLPDITKNDKVKKGWFNDTNLSYVQKFLKKFPNVYFYQGRFPETAKPLQKRKFCFVNLDTDLYESTLDGLKFFWPRMVKGGRIISHDYNNVQDIEGIKKAFKEFFKNHNEKLIEIADTQIMVVK
jgi:O-methyltransferase